MCNCKYTKSNFQQLKPILFFKIEPNIQDSNQ